MELDKDLTTRLQDAMNKKQLQGGTVTVTAFKISMPDGGGTNLAVYEGPERKEDDWLGKLRDEIETAYMAVPGIDDGADRSAILEILRLCKEHGEEIEAALLAEPDEDDEG